MERKVSKYRNTMGLLKCIDLSSNKLIGKLPKELASLEGLISLNLSRNNLTADIIQNVSVISRVFITLKFHVLALFDYVTTL